MATIRSNYPVFGGIIIAIALFPLIGVILACCLARQMSKQRYEQVDWGTRENNSFSIFLLLAVVLKRKFLEFYFINVVCVCVSMSFINPV